MDKQQDEIYCPECGKAIKKDFNICPYCKKEVAFNKPVSEEEKKLDYIRKRNGAILVTIGIVIIVVFVFIYLNSCNNLAEDFINSI